LESASLSVLSKIDELFSGVSLIGQSPIPNKNGKFESLDSSSQLGGYRCFNKPLPTQVDLMAEQLERESNLSVAK
jgi:hypothetical protein